MVTPLTTRAVNRWQRSGASMRTRARFLGALLGLLQCDLRWPQAPAGQRRELARDAQHRETVGPIRGDLDLEDVIVEPERRDEIGAGTSAGHLEDSRLVLLPDPELLLGAQHALRLDAVDLRGRDPAPARQHGARRREGGAHARARVRCAAYDRIVLASGADAAQDERVAVALAELALDGLDLADDHAFEIGRQRRDGRDLDAGVDEPLGGLRGRQPQIDELAHPPVRDLHRLTRTARGSAGRSRRTAADRRCRTSAS
jgi:hypothetical protein